MSSTELGEHLIPSVRNLAQHISTALELADEYAERVRAEETLRESEERYRSFTVASKQMLWTTHADGQVVGDIPWWREFTGQSEEQVKGWGWIEAIHPDDRERTASIWNEAVATKEFYEAEYRVRGHDGTYRWFLARGVPVLEKDGSIREWAGTSIDITELKRVEEALRESELRYRTLFESAPVGIGLAALDGQVLAYNDTICQMTGYSGAELKQINLRDLYQNPEERALLLRQLQRDGFVRNFEVALKRKDGTPYYASLTITSLTLGGEDVLLTVLENITERKQAEERVTHLNAVLRAIRNVNQLIVREEDRDRLLPGVCESLIETRGYYHAWIALVDKAGALVAAAEAGLGQSFLPLLEQLKRGEPTYCTRKALAQADVLIIEDPLSTCPDCPLSSEHSGR